MSHYDRILALTVGSIAAGVLLVGGPAAEPRVRHHHLQLQTGPLTVKLGGPGLARIDTAPNCLEQACPMLALSLEASAPAQGAPRQSRRMQACQPGALHRGRLIAERADERLGEQGRMCEPARPEAA